MEKLSHKMLGGSGMSKLLVAGGINAEEEQGSMRARFAAALGR
jgi:hypothetical protein